MSHSCYRTTSEVVTVVLFTFAIPLVKDPVLLILEYLHGGGTPVMVVILCFTKKDLQQSDAEPAICKLVGYDPAASTAFLLQYCLARMI